MDSITSVRDYLLKYKINPSYQRLVIMDYLIHYRTHPTAEEIYGALFEKIPTLSRTTVYNTLKLFAERGALLTLGIDEKNVRFDINTSDHAHFRCLRCGKVEDIESEVPGGMVLQHEKGLRITEKHVYYKGYCKTCVPFIDKE